MYPILLTIKTKFGINPINKQIKEINDLQGNIRQLEGQARRVNDLEK